MPTETAAMRMRTPSTTLNRARKAGACALASLVSIALALPAQAATALADQPLFSTGNVPGNLAFTLSVEDPTATTVAHPDTTYASASTYLGYFDPDKCYLYQSYATETANQKSHFYPAGLAGSHTCTGANNQKWSGNFLNWATMQTIDPFRWALTGGYRAVDTASLTILEKAWGTTKSNPAYFPNRNVSDATVIASATPFTGSSLQVKVFGLGNQMTVTIAGVGSSFYVRVKVCDATTAAGGLESNCKAYPSGYYKPEGLMQKYADRIRYSVFGYLNDSSYLRDGGVLRAQQKFIGPTKIVPGPPQTTAANTAQEWRTTDGTFYDNPDDGDATATANAYGIPISDSGVMNYINKFGETAQSYKSNDPVGELYYAAIRYFKNLGNVAAWSSMAGASPATKIQWADGFPIITNWADPVQYTCQKNFILGIGDVETHADKNVPGITATASEPSKPPEVAADTSVDAVVATNKVGNLQGIANLAGMVPYLCPPCNKNSPYMAGLAYDSNTKDIRLDLAGMQTIQTYWVDILAYGIFKTNNQFYLATKYGGFKVPDGYDTYGNTTPLPQAWWSTTGDIVGTGTTGYPSQPRPDNYFTAGRPDQMVSGLTTAFASIASQLKAFTTSSGTPLPQVAMTGNASYSAFYDAQNWTGGVIGSALSFDASTNKPTATENWRFADKLEAQAAGSGWDGGRVIATWNPVTAAGVPLRYASLSPLQQTALDTSYRSGNDGSDYLNYLRGSRAFEKGTTAATAGNPYRMRSTLLGDIVGSKAVAVGPPAAPYSNAANPGYSSFKAAKASRQTVVYVGANDGMLHAINGTLAGTDPGKELFAYVPSALFNGPTTPLTNANSSVDGLAALGNPTFVHHYYVNARHNVYDIDFAKTSGGSGAPNWRSVLIGGLGKGGKSYYAIDVTDPAAITGEATLAGKVLWEFTDPDLGFTHGDPVVAKTKKYGWVVIFVSGYNSGKAGAFFIVNPRNGALLEKRSTAPLNPADTTISDGLAQVGAFVLDRTDQTADAAYAGDLLGNLWRLDLTGTPLNYPAPVRIAQLTDASGNVQPVTTSPVIEAQAATNKRFVMVGTGRLLDSGDIASTQVQTFYSLLDGTGMRFNASSDLPSGVTFPVGRAKLVPNSDSLATTSGVTLAANSMGWYYDLGAGALGIGWRVLIDPKPFNGTIAFATTLPNGSACSPSGQSNTYNVDFGSGKSQLTSTTTDPVNGASTTTAIAYNTTASGIVTDLQFFSVGGTVRLIAGTDAGNLNSLERKASTPPGLRRLNWRELPLVD